jgi:hypothetical protein
MKLSTLYRLYCSIFPADFFQMIRYTFRLRFVRELLSNTASSARFWSVIFGYWGVNLYSYVTSAVKKSSSRMV